MSVIRILHPIEIREYESPPLFDSFGRKKFLFLPTALTGLLEISRHPSSKIALVIQCGYFRARHRFFGTQFCADDIAFVAARLALSTPKFLQLSKQTLLRQRQAIAECFGARQFLQADRKTLSIDIAGWVQSGYRYPTKRVAPGSAVDAKDMAPLTGLVVKSLITTPLDGASLPRGPITIGGFAWAGETDIARVDVSTDHGASWQPARLTGDAVRFAWRRFEYSFRAEKAETYTILSRATDARGQAQPSPADQYKTGYE